MVGALVAMFVLLMVFSLCKASAKADEEAEKFFKEKDMEE